MGSALIPRLQKLKTSDSTYQRRTSIGYLHQTLISSFPKELQSVCLPELLSELKNSVPNVRMVTLKVLRSVYDKLDEAQRQAVKGYSNVNIEMYSPSLRIPMPM